MSIFLRQGASRKRPDLEPIELRVEIPEPLSPGLTSLFVVSLLKSLLYQRGQIPVQHEVIQRDAEKTPDDEEEEEDDETLPIRERLKLRAARVKRRKLRSRYLRSVSEFELCFQSLRGHLEEEVRASFDCISSVSFLFGATPISPKEVFQISLPPPPRTNGTPPTYLDLERRSRKIGLHLFRRMLTHEGLLSRISRNLGLSNVYVAVQKTATEDERSCPHYMRPSPELGRLRWRGRRTHFILRCNEHYVPESSSTSSTSPVPMDLCGDESLSGSEVSCPLPSPHAADPASRRGSAMMETPCVISSRRRIEEGQRRSRSIGSGRTRGDLVLDEAENMELQDLPRQDWFIFTDCLKGFRDPQARLK